MYNHFIKPNSGSQPNSEKDGEPSIPQPKKLLIFSSRSLSENEQKQIDLFRKIFIVKKETIKLGIQELLNCHDIIVFDVRVSDIRKYVVTNIDFIRNCSICFVRSIHEGDDDLLWAKQIAGTTGEEERIRVHRSIKLEQAATFDELISELCDPKEKIQPPEMLWWWVLKKIALCIPIFRKSK